MRKILLYALVGAWGTDAGQGCKIIEISEDTELLQRELREIAESEGGEYTMGHLWGKVSVESSDRYYKITDDAGGWALFYISEHYVDISGELMGAIGREMERIDRTADIEAYLEMLYESGSIEPWKYEYMKGNDAVMKEILVFFENTESGSIPYNTTLDGAITAVQEGIALNDGVLEYLWEKFGDVPVDDDERILDGFLKFDAGTHREAVWRWFDVRHSKGVAALMGTA